METEVVDFQREKVVISKVEVTSNVEDLTNQVETGLEEVQAETLVNQTVVEATVGERNTKI